MERRPEKLLLLDSASLYFRAFYGVPETVRAPDGTSVNAVRGFLDIIARLVSSYSPTHVVACWDDDWRPQWRVDLIPSYKAHRVAEAAPRLVADGTHRTNITVDIEEMPDPLAAQIPLIREALARVGIPVVGAPQHEADDVIGTLATRHDADAVDIVTGDRDLFQLIDDERDIRIVYTAKGMSNLEVITDETLFARYAVHAHQYADFAVMRGDASDGLPGVAGVGEKTAAALLQSFGDLDGITTAAAAGAPGITPAVRGRIASSAAYLRVAPAVVQVVRDLDLPHVDARLPVLDADARTRATEFATRWGLTGSMTRLVDALPH